MKKIILLIISLMFLAGCYIQPVFEKRPIRVIHYPTYYYYSPFYYQHHRLYYPKVYHVKPYVKPPAKKEVIKRNEDTQRIRNNDGQRNRNNDSQRKR